MVSWGVGGMWTGFGLIVAWWLRPRRARHVGVGAPVATRPASSHRRGRLLAAAAAAAVLMLFNIWLAVGVGLLAWLRPRLASRRNERLATSRVLAELPDVVDLLVLTTSAGLTARQSVATVARYGHGPVFEAFGRLDARTSAGGRFGDGLDLLTDWVGPASTLR